MPNRRASPTRKDAPMKAVAASETRPNAIDVGLKHACQTGVLGPLTATRPEAIARRAAAKKKGARTDEVPNTTPVLRRPLAPAQTWRKAKEAPRRMRARRAKARSGCAP